MKYEFLLCIVHSREHFINSIYKYAQLYNYVYILLHNTRNGCACHVLCNDSVTSLPLGINKCIGLLIESFMCFDLNK